MQKPHSQTTFETIHFKSKDGLLITADFYALEHAEDLILLCHRSHCNRGEYRETAPQIEEFRAFLSSN